MTRKLKIMENKKHPLDNQKNDEITEKRENENEHCRTWNIARKLKITENEKYTHQDMKYCEEN